MFPEGTSPGLSAMAGTRSPVGVSQQVLLYGSVRLFFWLRGGVEAVVLS